MDVMSYSKGQLMIVCSPTPVDAMAKLVLTYARKVLSDAK